MILKRVFFIISLTLCIFVLGKQSESYSKTIYQSQHKENKFLQNSTSSGSFHKGNYIWGGAMNICWNTLSEDIIKEPIRLQAYHQEAKRLVHSLTHSNFSKNDLKDNSYYTKAGYGKQTLDMINKQVKEKFPDKSFSPLEFDLQPSHIISYAYFKKDVQYVNPFTLTNSFNFKGQQVKGFEAQTFDQFDNIRICKYINNSEFVIRINLKQEDQELYLIKGGQNKKPEDIIQQIKANTNCHQILNRHEKFGMPVINIDVQRRYNQLIGLKVLNQQFSFYSISQMFENIKFTMNQVGAKVQNQAVIVMIDAMIMPPERNFILDSSFWVAMKQKQKQPYFVVQINNSQFMQNIK